MFEYIKIKLLIAKINNIEQIFSIYRIHKFNNKKEKCVTKYVGCTCPIVNAVYINFCG